MNKGTTKIDKSQDSQEYISDVTPPDTNNTDRELSDEELSAKSLHDYTISYPPPEIVLSVNDKIWGTRGNFSVISGQAKSKKTFLIAGLLPALLKQELILNRFRGHSITKRPKILYFDTEQSPYHLQDRLESSFNLGNLAKSEITDRMKVFRLRPRTIEERFRIVNHEIEKSNNVNLVVIDGIRDLMYDINSSAESSEVISYLLKWSYENELHIITVIHNNKGDNKIRGHIGSELINKCETHIDIAQHDKNPSISIVTFKNSRNKLPDPFGFKINNYGNIENLDPSKATAGNTKPIPDSITRTKYQKAINSAFKDNKELNKGQLTDRFKMHFKVGMPTAKDYIIHCEKKLKLISKKKGRNNANIYKKV